MQRRDQQTQFLFQKQNTFIDTNTEVSRIQILQIFLYIYIKKKKHKYT